MLFFTLTRHRSAKFMMILAALAWACGRAPADRPCTVPVRLDRVEDGSHAVLLIGPKEIEVVVPYSDAVAALASRDDGARERIEAKIVELRARRGRLPPAPGSE